MSVNQKIRVGKGSTNFAQQFQLEGIPITHETLEENLGSVEVLRSDYGLEIPSVPNVADVSNQVFLEIYFAAEK